MTDDGKGSNLTKIEASILADGIGSESYLSRRRLNYFLCESAMVKFGTWYNGETLSKRVAFSWIDQHSIQPKQQMLASRESVSPLPKTLIISVKFLIGSSGQLSNHLKRPG
ncbi:hypothetical protein HZ326_11558 [Fusarium oxysporum f. sp. albedinis]|nr:hypothetical protein HZ326_11558 [Fusarium oxysporum f. sp. albedinis]